MRPAIRFAIARTTSIACRSHALEDAPRAVLTFLQTRSPRGPLPEAEDRSREARHHDNRKRGKGKEHKRRKSEFLEHSSCASCASCVPSPLPLRKPFCSFNRRKLTISLVQ